MKKLSALFVLTALCGLLFAQNWHTQEEVITSTGTYYTGAIDVEPFVSHITSRFRLVNVPIAHWASTTWVTLETRYGNFFTPNAGAEGWYFVDSLIQAADGDDTVTTENIFLLDSLKTSHWDIGEQLRLKIVVNDTVTADSTFDDTSTVDWRWSLGFR